MGSLTDDPRWEAPPPLRFEIQLASLFFGALDAFDVTTGILRRRASQQAFNGLRFQMETVALIRWMTEPTDPYQRQERAYRVLCGQITRYARFLIRDAGRDREALQGVHELRRWGERLREIAKQDGIEDLKQELGRPELLKRYGPKRCSACSRNSGRIRALSGISFSHSRLGVGKSPTSVRPSSLGPLGALLPSYSSGRLARPPGKPLGGMTGSRKSYRSSTKRVP